MLNFNGLIGNKTGCNVSNPNKVKINRKLVRIS